MLFQEEMNVNLVKKQQYLDVLHRKKVQLVALLNLIYVNQYQQQFKQH
jgi:hypothetical protein